MGLSEIILLTFFYTRKINTIAKFFWGYIKNTTLLFWKYLFKISDQNTIHILYVRLVYCTNPLIFEYILGCFCVNMSSYVIYLFSFLKTFASFFWVALLWPLARNETVGLNYLSPELYLCRKIHHNTKYLTMASQERT